MDKEHYQLSESARKGLPSLRESMTQFQASQTELLAKFTNFVKEHHSDSVGLIDADPEYHLRAFIERYAVPLLRRGVAGSADVPTPWGELRGVEYLVGSYVLYLEANDAATFGYLIDAVKGAILLGVLEMGPGDLQQKLNDLTVVFDTPVLLNALGYQGRAPERAATQLIDLARQLRVRLVCFDHTVKEVDWILEAAATALKRSNRTTEGRSPVYHHFLEANWTPADVAIEQTKLTNRLRSLDVRIISPPEKYFKYGLDEDALEDLLKEVLPTQRDGARLHDLKSLSAIHRLRKGVSPVGFERCGYVLVTNNYGLTVVGRRVDEQHGWPLAMLDSDIASLLWVRSPAVAEDLPRQQLVAAVYTAMQPAAHLWVKYIEEIERLQERGWVASDEAVVLRSIPEAREALMDVTLGESSKINTGAVQVIVERVRENLRSPYRSEADDARAERDQAAREATSARQEREQMSTDLQSVRSKLDALDQENLARTERISQRASSRARTIVLGTVSALALILVTPSVVSLIYPDALTNIPGWAAILVAIPGAALIALTVVQQFFGGIVRDWFRRPELRLARRIERRMRVAAGLTASPSIGTHHVTNSPE